MRYIVKSDRWFIYKLLSDSGDLLYIGMAQDVKKRIWQHTRSKAWGEEIAVHSIVADAKTEILARGIESKLIRSSNPKYNKQHSYTDELPTVVAPLTSKQRYQVWYSNFAMKRWYSVLFYVADGYDYVEIPLYVLREKIDRPSADIFFWESRDKKQSLEIRSNSNSYGRATIFDKDLLIYILSHFVNAARSGRPESDSRTFYVDVHNYLMCTQKVAGPGAYARFIATLNRSLNTRIVREEKSRVGIVREEDGIIDSWRVKDSSSAGLPITVEIVLSEWVFQTFKKRSFFRIPHAYFQCSAAITRRIHELAGARFSVQTSWFVPVRQLLIMADPTRKLYFPSSFFTSQTLPGFSVNVDSANKSVRLSPKYEI